MKKGQTESYSFLIGIIITVLILTGIGCAAYQLYRPKGKESFDRLTDILQDLEKEGIDDDGDIPIYVEEDEVLLGFGKNQEYIGEKGWKSIFNWNCYGIKFAWGVYTPFGVTGSIDRPAKCPLDKSCLCLCKIKSVPYRVTEDACQGNVRCEIFATLDFIGGEGCPQGVFVPGRKHGFTEGDFVRGLETLYYSKKGNIVSIDDIKPKTVEEIKDIIEEDKIKSQEKSVINLLKGIHDSFIQCRSKKDCTCDNIKLELLEDYKIVIEKKKDYLLVDVGDNRKEVLKFTLLNPKDKPIYLEGKKVEEEIVLHAPSMGIEELFAGLIYSQGEKINFGDECKKVTLSSTGVELGKGCKNPRDWSGKTEIYIVNKEGLYLSLDPERKNCF